MPSKKALYMGLGVAAVGGALGYLLWKKLDDDSDDDEDDWRYSKTSSSRPVSVEVRVAKEHAGLVIGRQGSNIKEIQNKTNTRIHFKNELEEEKERTLIIKGRPDDAQLAEILIQQTIINQPRVETVEFRIPHQVCGLLIGRSGEVIRGIQNQSRCKIDVERGPPDSNGMKRVTLKGTTEQISAAKFLIDDRLSEDKTLRRNIQKTQEFRPPRIKYRQPLLLTSEEPSENSQLPPSKATEELKPTASDNVMEVYVSSISDPGHFYVQKVGPRSVQLDRLVQEMSKYYDQKVNQDIHALVEIEVGDIVATRFGCDGNWYRAKVIYIVQNDYDPSKSNVSVDFVDFGDCETKLKSEIFDLRTDFLKLNFQAIECSIANIAPKSGDSWTTECCDDFERLTHSAQWKVLLAKIVDYRSVPGSLGGVKPSLELYNTNSFQDINVGNELIKLGHAVRVKNTNKEADDEEAKEEDDEEAKEDDDEEEAKEEEYKEEAKE